MRWIYKLPLRLRSLFRKQRVEDELNDELRFHLERLIEENIASGMSADQARYAALREFGGIEQMKEECRDSWGVRLINEIAQDARYGLRQLSRNPGFTAIAILTLALGIGANTAIFSLLNAVMLRQLPVQNPGQLVLLGTGRARGNTSAFAYTNCYSYPFYLQVRQKNQVFSETSAVLSMLFERMHGKVGQSASLESMNVQLVSGTYFSMLGVRPIMGRTFTEAQDAPAGGHPIAIASYSWWNRRFSRDPSIVGKTVTFRSTVYTIIGVTPPEFFGTEVGESPDLWIPLSMEKQVSPGWNGLDDKWFESLYLLGRLKPGVTVAQADAGVNLLARQIWHGFAGPVLTQDQRQRLARAHIPLTPAARGLSHLRNEFSLPLQVLMVVVGLVLLIACVNIANLLLARATTRQREIAVRMAIGAGRRRLVRQMLTESLMVALFGGILGILFASWASAALLAMVSTGQSPLPLSVTPDGRVFAFTFVVCCLTALLFGTVPALRATRVDLTPALKEARGGAPAAGRSRLAKSLVVSQVALSLVLLVGAGLFLRTLITLASVDTGFSKGNVLLFAIDPAAVGYKEDSHLANLYQQIEQKVSAEPGVRAASVSFFTFSQGSWSTGIVVQGRASQDADPNIVHNVVGPRYFAAMGIPLLVGRVLGPQDTATSPKVAVINEIMAKKYFPGGSPIGRRFGVGDDPKGSGNIEVVGVVGDAKYVSLDEKPQPAAYYPYTQNIGYYKDFEVRYTGAPSAIIAEVRRAVAEVDRSLPITYQSTLEEQVGQSVASQTLVARLSAFFGLLAVFLACIGIYGLMSYAVTRRTNEIGIRMAMGAGTSSVLWMVMRESLILVGIGLLIGLPISLAGGRLVSSMLVGLSPADPLSIAVAAFLLLAFAMLAGYLPARRAAKVDPMVALRYE
ncbi:MAG TPA: ABC transporter permease [Terriglobia bacterium]|nr:ABC transporter permease [Terriglobia bacterium]